MSQEPLQIMTLPINMKYRDMLTREFLIKEYVDNKRSPYSIAEEIGCAPKTVYVYIKRYGIEQRDCTRQLSPGQIFNWLTTIKVIDKRSNGMNIWLCNCICGRQTKVETGHLRNGNIKSCGCQRFKKGDKHHAWKGCGKISANFWHHIKHCAKHRNIDFEVSIQQISELLEKQDYYCKLSGLQLYIDKGQRTASLDRIDSSKSYTIDNVQWVHKDINKIKASFSLAGLLKYCKFIIYPNLEPNHDFVLIDNIASAFWSDIKYNATKRNKTFEINTKDIVHRFNQQQAKCYITGLRLSLPDNNTHYRTRTHTASLDRVDNNLGYIPGNISWCHKDINQSRKDLDLTYYKYLAILLLRHNKENQSI